MKTKTYYKVVEPDEVTVYSTRELAEKHVWLNCDCDPDEECTCDVYIREFESSEVDEHGNVYDAENDSYIAVYTSL